MIVLLGIMNVGEKYLCFLTLQLQISRQFFKYLILIEIRSSRNLGCEWCLVACSQTPKPHVPLEERGKRQNTYSTVPVLGEMVHQRGSVSGCLLLCGTSIYGVRNVIFRTFLDRKG